MDRIEFQLTIFRQNRLLVVIFFTPITLIISLFIGLELSYLHPLNLVISGSIIILLGIGLFHLSVGRLSVELKNQTLEFRWQHKAMFNYKPIEAVKLNEVRTLVINEGILLKEIQTDDRRIAFGTAKLFKRDSAKFIDFLKRNTSAHEIDSWEVWKRRGWLAIAYRINTFIIVAFSMIPILFILVKGFNSALLLFIPFVLFQLIGYQLLMKSRL